VYLDFEKKDTDIYVIDIESDSLQPTCIWVMCWRNVRTGETGTCTTTESIREFFESTAGALYVGHNILLFDAPVLVRLCGVDLSYENCIDTLVLSTLYSPNIEDGHSLDAWGARLGNAKITFNDWSKLSDEMVEYCHKDVEITAQLFRRLVKTLNNLGFSELTVRLQHRLTVIMDNQRRAGFYFNAPEALYLYQFLRQREKDLADEIRLVFPAERVLVAERPMYRKDGQYTAQYQKDDLRFVLAVDELRGVYQAFEDVEFNIGSPNQRIEKLLALGWEPEEFTPKTKKGGGGNPKPFDKGKLSPSLERFLETHDVPEVEMIARWMSINGRANMINTWLDNYNETDHCIHGKLFVADTLRFRHQAPNTANIPAVRVDKQGNVLREESGYYTYEARNLWCARPGRTLVGTDASGLELRMLAHFLNRPKFTESVVEGDPHQYNADTAGVTRPQAKTLIYAILYGAAAPKIAKILGVSTREGAQIREMFLSRLGLKDLMEAAQQEQKRGRIELVDGAFVVCPSPHSALNYKLQGSGARVMGVSAVLADDEVRKNNWDVIKVGDIHDEDQSDCAVEVADDFGGMRVSSIIRAGTILRLNVPLDGTYKKGLTWACTH